MKCPFFNQGSGDCLGRDCAAYHDGAGACGLVAGAFASEAIAQELYKIRIILDAVKK